MKTEGGLKGGRTAGVLRSVRSTVSAEVLPEEHWEDLAAHELKRLEVELSIYQMQLQDRPGYIEVSAAVSALKAARRTIAESVA